MIGTEILEFKVKSYIALCVSILYVDSDKYIFFLRKKKDKYFWWFAFNGIKH